HCINATAVWKLAFGKGRAFLNSSNRAVNALVGGWQFATIYRWNTGLPIGDPYDDARWATNWNVQADVTPTSAVHTCPSRTSTPKLFGGHGCALRPTYQGFRNAYPGESGPRNAFRQPNYMNADMGIGKSFDMPWAENQKLQLRWEVFNVANFQPFGTIDGSRTGLGVVRDPLRRNSSPPSNWATFTAIQANPRVMQVAARFSF